MLDKKYLEGLRSSAKERFLHRVQAGRAPQEVRVVPFGKFYYFLGDPTKEQILAVVTPRTSSAR